MHIKFVRRGCNRQKLRYYCNALMRKLSVSFRVQVLSVVRLTMRFYFCRFPEVVSWCFLCDIRHCTQYIEVNTDLILSTVFWILYFIMV